MPGLLVGTSNLKTGCERAKCNVLFFWHHLLSKIATVSHYHLGDVPGWPPEGLELLVSSLVSALSTAD